MHMCTSSLWNFPPFSSPPFLITTPPLFLFSFQNFSSSPKPPPNSLSLSLSLLFLHMGTCFSSTEADYSALTASVISVNGALRRYPLPINASQALGLETSSPSSFFLCNSDHLFFDEFIPPLDATQQLDVGQIYFVLPLARLQYPVTAREMAGMAVKASMALVQGSKKKSRRNRMQISPLSDFDEKVLENEDEEKKTEKDVVGRSKSLKRVMSRKGKPVGQGQRQWQRHFKATLTTIHEACTAE